MSLYGTPTGLALLPLVEELSDVPAKRQLLQINRAQRRVLGRANTLLDLYQKSTYESFAGLFSFGTNAMIVPRNGTAKVRVDRRNE